MEKLNAPEIGWLSAETACHATVYVPSGRSSRRSTPYLTTEPSHRSRSSPPSARLPPGSSTRMSSSPRATCSEKVSVTRCGAVATTAPSAGSLPVSTECADAVPAPVPNSTAASSSRARTR